MTSYPAENYELVLQETMDTSSASVGILRSVVFFNLI